MRLLIKSYPPAERCGRSFVRDKLSNSGDTLEHQVPSYALGSISGWSNYSCTVTSLEDSEKEVGYRGSKSAISEGVVVKEQRVNGSCCINSIQLRCTLTGFARNYQMKILSNQICLPIFREFSSISSQSSIKNPEVEVTSCALHPWFITGFVDGEGSFMIRVRRKPKYRLGFAVEAGFSITLHKKDLMILQEIQTYFGVGYIRNDLNNKVKFKVESVKDIVNKVIPHFEKYPLITQKLADYILFREVVNMMINKEHLTKKGLNKIVSIKAVINLGLPAELQVYFPDVIPTFRPCVENKTVPDGQWMAGFTSAEGCFKITLVKRPNRRIDQVYLVFQITQHSRDERLLESFIAFFGCGILEASSRDPIVNFSVYKFSDNDEKIIPFFQKCNVFGVKSDNFKDWCRAAEIIKAKQHTTEEGLNRIITLKSGINKGRQL